MISIIHVPCSKESSPTPPSERSKWDEGDLCTNERPN